MFGPIRLNFNVGNEKYIWFMSNMKMCIIIYFNIYQLDYIIVLNQPQAITSFNKLTVVRIVIFLGFLRPRKVVREANLGGCEAVLGPWYSVLSTQNSVLGTWSISYKLMEMMRKVKMLL